MHIRKQIRDKIKELLIGLSITKDNIFFDLLSPINKNKLPALVLSTENETINNITVGYPALQERVLTLNIHGVIKTNYDLQDNLDEILSNVESILNLQINKKLDDLVTKVNQVEVNTDLNGELDESVGVIQIVYQITYRCYENNTSISI